MRTQLWAKGSLNVLVPIEVLIVVISIVTATKYETTSATCTPLVLMLLPSTAVAKQEAGVILAARLRNETDLLAVSTVKDEPAAVITALLSAVIDHLWQAGTAAARKE